MNQRFVLFFLNLYSKGHAIYHEITSIKRHYQLSWFNQNKRASPKLDLIPAYQNSTRRSVLSTYLFYNVERNMMVVLYKLAESLEFFTTKRYQNPTKPSNLVFFKSICQTMSKTACFDKGLKIMS
jgi:hypothetical protein